MADCRNPYTGRPRRAYFSRSEAEISAEEYQARFGTEQVAWFCADGCERWHLTCPEHYTPSHPCSSCTSSRGEPKDAYETKDAAERRARLIEKKRPGRLRVYPCPSGQGWHLTKG